MDLLLECVEISSRVWFRLSASVKCRRSGSRAPAIIRIGEVDDFFQRIRVPVPVVPIVATTVPMSPTVSMS